MNRRLRLGAVATTTALLGLCGAAATQAAASPALARPNPALVGVHLDYVSPIPGAFGGAATPAPLGQAVIPHAVTDQEYLAEPSDLGGFGPTRTGPGRNLVGRASGRSEIPQLTQAANGKVASFAAIDSEPSPTPPDQGLQPVPGLGTPPPVTPPSNTNTVPPPNQGFGGRPTPKPPTTTTTTRPTPTTRPAPTTPPPTTTTVPTTTTTPATTPTTTTTPAPSPSPPSPGGASCGTTGLTITSDRSTCRIVAVNMAPGDEASEVLTVRNDSGQPFTVSLRAGGTVNALWHALRLGVWEAGTAAPAPLPDLLWWTSQANTLATLEPGESIRYQIELYLPATASNAVQGMTASIDLIWKAQG
jgi:hypothetical protein